MEGKVGCKILLFGNSLSLIDVSQLFESTNTLEKSYFLLFARSKSILFINLETLITCELLAYASH